MTERDTFRDKEREGKRERESEIATFRSNIELITNT